jgi:PAS domain S-box-containing protein
MTLAAQPAPQSNDDSQAVAVAFRAQQLATHAANLPWAIVGSMMVALFFVAGQWSAVPHPALLGWLAAVAAVLSGRAVVELRRARAAQTPASDRLWLRRYRIGFLAHGITWGLASALPLPAGDDLHQAVLIVLLAGITAGSFALTAFDLVAALAFGVPTLGLLSLRLLTQDPAAYVTLGAAALGALAFLSLTARRSNRMVRHYVALRVAEATQAAALRSSEELLERTGATAGVGGWELDTQTNTLRLTAQACRIHGIAADAGPALADLAACYLPEHRSRIRAAFDAAALGTAFDLELPLTSTDGTPRWVRLIGQPLATPGPRQRISGVVQDITQRKRTDLALAEKHRLLTLLIATTSEGFWFVDTQAVTTDANPAMCQILGRPREALIGKSIFDFVDADNRAVFAEEIARRAQGVAGGYEITLTRADGARIACFNHATPIVDSNGARIGSIGMWTDISAHKRAEQQLRAAGEQLAQKTHALESMLDSISQGIISIDREGLIVVHNQRALELLDLPPGLMEPGATYDDVTQFQVRRGDVATTQSEILDVGAERPYFAHQRSAAPEVYVRRNRQGALIEVRTKQLAGGGMVRTYADVTAYLEAQQALLAAKNEAERANRAKSQFLSGMSHELRTPMNAILGFGQLLVSDVKHPLAAHQQAQMAEILRGARHLLRLINEVLDLAVVETGKLQVNLETVAVGPLIQACINLMAPLARDNSVSLTAGDATNCDCSVIADPTRLQQVLLNLLSNAIKYNRHGGFVQARCRREGAMLRISIEDSGPGLTTQQHDRLFEAFERLDAAAGPVEGAGLGLALSRGLVQAMHGEIGLDSQIGRGSTFWVLLPATMPVSGPADSPATSPPASPASLLPLPAPDRKPQAAPLPGAAAHPAARQRLVLYIEDNPVNLVLMEAILERVAGLRLITAALPQAGLERALRESPDLILLDIQLPGMDGYEVLRRLRQHEATRDIPVIAVSANAMDSDVKQGLAAGFVDYLTKPLDMDRLLAAVDPARSRH